MWSPGKGRDVILLLLLNTLNLLIKAYEGFLIMLCNKS